MCCREWCTRVWMRLREYQMRRDGFVPVSTTWEEIDNNIIYIAPTQPSLYEPLIAATNIEMRVVESNYLMQPDVIAHALHNIKSPQHTDVA